MLKQLRNKKIMKRILWALVILIIPPFTFWGVGAVMRSGQKGPTYAGIIFGKKISFEEYGRVWKAARNQALLTYGSRFNEIADDLNLDRQTWERLILLAEAKKRKAKVSDQEVIDTIKNFPFLQSKGQFDKRSYDLILAQVFRISAREFEEGIRGSVTIAKLINSITKDIKVKNKEVIDAYKKEKEKARISYILVPPDRFKNSIEVRESQIEGYYKNNSESFRIPEQVNVEYLGFEDLLAAEKIDYILADKTKTFEEVAKENSLPIKETGFFSKDGPIPQIGWFPEIQRCAFGLNIGERSELLKSTTEFAKGYYIIKLKDKKASHIPALEEVRNRIEDTLKQEGAVELASKEASRLHKRLLELINTRNMKFEEAAAKIARKIKYAEPFARNGYIQGLGMASELGETAFNTEPGRPSDVTKTRAGFCIFNVTEIIPLDERKFKKERKEFAKKTLEAKKMKALDEWYIDLMKRAGLKSNIPIPAADALSPS